MSQQNRIAKDIREVFAFAAKQTTNRTARRIHRLHCLMDALDECQLPPSEHEQIYAPLESAYCRTLLAVTGMEVSD